MRSAAERVRAVSTYGLLALALVLAASGAWWIRSRTVSGSSARKLRRLDVNLLAGRVIERAMFPLVSRELGPDGASSRESRVRWPPIRREDVKSRSQLLHR